MTHWSLLAQPPSHTASYNVVREAYCYPNCENAEDLPWTNFQLPGRLQLSSKPVRLINKRLLEQENFDVGMYRPHDLDDQAPHMRDELYAIASGTGTFFCAGEREKFGPGDVSYVAAGIEHRFENFSNDFATWVIFVGMR